MHPDQQKAWRDGYAAGRTAGFKSATLADRDKPDPKQEERRRIINILKLHADDELLQKVIPLIESDTEENPALPNVEQALS